MYTYFCITDGKIDIDYVPLVMCTTRQVVTHSAA